MRDRIELGPGEEKQIEIRRISYNQGVEALRAHWVPPLCARTANPKGRSFTTSARISRYKNPALNLNWHTKMSLTWERRFIATGRIRSGMSSRKTYTDDAVTREDVLRAGDLRKNAGVVMTP